MPEPQTIALMDSDMGDCEIERAILEGSGLRLEDLRGADRVRLDEVLRGAQGLMVQYASVDASLLSRCPKLRAVVTYGVGTDHIDRVEAEARGIVVLPVTDYCVNEVADHTLALVLACTRSVSGLANAVCRGEWPATSSLGSLLSIDGLRYGLIGFGSIGQAVARRARAFGADVRAFDPFAPDRVFDREEVTRVSLEEAFCSDIVSVHVPLTPDTFHLVTGELLGRIPTHGVFVNVARGDVVEESALTELALSGRVTVALDVMSQEPPPADHILARSDRVIVTPHVAWFSTTAEHRLREKAAMLIGRQLTE